MDGDWTSGLSPEDREAWDEFVDNFRRDALLKMENSAFVASLVPGEFDVKFAVELGAAIMLDKPIVAIAMPGARIPDTLRRIAAEVIETDVDTEEGRREIGDALARVGDTIRKQQHS